MKLFLDGADLDSMRRAVRENPLIRGFTTNPTLMRKAGVTDYATWGKEALGIVGDRPISFEVFSDDFAGMEREARIIHGWGSGTYVKIPVTNTRGESTAPVVRRLTADGVRVNVTAVMTVAQVGVIAGALREGVPAVVSVFAGRIANTGLDPVPTMVESLRLLGGLPGVELLWASPRELLNVFQANDCGCHIITITQGFVDQLALVGKDLDEYSLETVKMFYDDARAAGYRL
ncbi:MAG: transaldolase [Magnetococcales bacterium]|nr:transaldolase [Magnetococcales bacterium]